MNEKETVRIGADNHQASGSRDLQSKGVSIGEACKKIGVTEQTFYCWRKQYGGMQIEQAKRLKELEKENLRLKKLVADLSPDNAILKEVSKGNF